MAGKRKVSWSVDEDIVRELNSRRDSTGDPISSIASGLLREAMEMERVGLVDRVMDMERRLERLEEVARGYE